MRIFNRTRLPKNEIRDRPGFFLFFLFSPLPRARCLSGIVGHVEPSSPPSSENRIAPLLRPFFVPLGVRGRFALRSDQPVFFRDPPSFHALLGLPRSSPGRLLITFPPPPHISFSPLLQVFFYYRCFPICENCLMFSFYRLSLVSNSRCRRP